MNTMLPADGPSAASPPRDRRAVWIIGALLFGSLASALMQSLVIPIQSELPSFLDTSASNASWVLTATLLGAGVTMPLVGRLADVLGKKPVLVAAASVLIVGSLVCAVSDSLTFVLVGRVLQGMAMGYIPVAISMVREVAPPHMVNSATAAVSATLGVGGALGLPLAAWIAQDHDWHALFWVATALAVVMLVLSVVVLPNTHDAHPASIDWVGAAGLAAGLVGVLVGVSKGNDWGWGEPLTIGMIAGGVVVLLAWGWFELRHHDPLVDLRTMAKKSILLTNIAAVLIGFGMMAQSIVVPQLLQMPEATGYGLGQSILAAGLWMAPGGLMMMLFAPVSSKLLTSYGARVTLAIGAAVLALGYVAALFLMDAPWQLMIASCISLAGVGVGYAAMPTMILSNVPPTEASSSVSVNTLMRSIGTTVAGAVMAVVLTSKTMDLGGYAVPTQGAFQLCFVVGAIAAGLGALVILLAPRRARDDAAALAVTPDTAPEAELEPAATR
ncbi:MFS transporter [Luteimicrobium subarcticum]|uniref:MFS transporter n=1 Tax=Luteimicrobium subarcticum TaxID=620910 RepID=A0A2M8WJV2_9MICO|nr:MFS transporter [Luteimicrobium subarcticum]PJI91178.1 MFS transporter [Luteimicrobium subarcticum]